MYDYDYRVDFNITHPTNSLDEFTGLLQGFPVSHIKHGDERHNRTGKSLGRKATISHLNWRLHLDEELQSTLHPLDELLLKVFSRLDKQKQLLKKIRNNGGAMALEIALRPSHCYAACIMSPNLLEKFWKYGIELDLCIIVPPGRLY